MVRQRNILLHSNRKKNSGTVEQFFSIRKRASGEGDEDIDRLGKRFKTNANISDQIVPDKENLDPDSAYVTDSSCEGFPEPAPIPTPLGVFGQIPTELVFHFFSQTPANQLARMALSSHSIRNRIESYVFQVAGSRRFQQEARINDQQSDCFTQWGQLLKSLTCSSPTSSRIEMLKKFYAMNSSVVDCSGWGRLAVKMTQYWDFDECAKVFRAFLHFDDGKVLKTLDVALRTAVPGTTVEAEMMIRNYLRPMFLEHNFSDIRDLPFWTSVLLMERKDISERARLLIILYGPTKTNNGRTEIDWRSLCDFAPTSLVDAKRRVEPFSKAFDALLTTKDHNMNRYSWSEVDMFALIEEVTTIPEPWALDNFASLLLFRSRLSPIALASRCNNGYVQEAGQIVNTMKTLTYRWRCDPPKALNPTLQPSFQHIPTTIGRRSFFSSIMEATFTRIKELINDNSNTARLELMEEIASIGYCNGIWTNIVTFI